MSPLTREILSESTASHTDMQPAIASVDSYQRGIDTVVFADAVQRHSGRQDAVRNSGFDTTLH